MRLVSASMRTYYDRRAGEYDDWWLGRGQFADRDRPCWRAEVDTLIRLVSSLPPARVLDVGCGTGFLTRYLTGHVTGVDQSVSMLRIAATRVGAALIHADAGRLPFPVGGFDRVFASCFYGHLLADERRVFLEQARRVASELVVVDAAVTGAERAEQWQRRRLDDGSEHVVYKRFFTARALADELGGGDVLHDGRWFVAVSSRPAEDAG
jgi:ubiquinone/menaquinone biosynthesis C-methylase UbiE